MSTDLETLQLELVSNDASVSPLGMVLPEGLNFDAWASIGKKLKHAGRALQWCTADWAAFGQRKFGKLGEFAQVNGMNSAALHVMAIVAESIPQDRRRSQLEWGFHEAVISMKPKKQDDWLEKAIEDNMDISAFRKAIRMSNGEKFAGESDVAPAKSMIRLVTVLQRWLRSHQEGFWTDERKKAWREILGPIVDFYNSLV